MKICLLCGTFNPIHNGHIKMAEFVEENFNFDKIIFIPTYISPFKQDLDENIAQDRLKMVQIAVKNNEKFACSDIEYKMNNVSYTYNTIVALYKKYQGQIEGRINFIIGYDAFLSVARWHKSKQLKDIVKLLVFPRKLDDNINVNIIDKKIEKLKENDYEFSILDFAPYDISSSQIRENVRTNKSIDYMVPEEVKEYIYEKNLYK